MTRNTRSSERIAWRSRYRSPRRKAELIAVADRVAATGEAVVVTRRGKPLIRLVPVEAPASLEGNVTYLVDEEELIYGSLGEWDAEGA